MTAITRRTMIGAIVVASASLSLAGAGPARAVFVPVVPLPADLTALISRHTAVAVSDPVASADRLIRAWGRGDRAAASVYAGPEVISALWGFSSPGGRCWVRVGSQGAAGTRFVTYHDRARGGSLILGVDATSTDRGGTHSVYRVDFSTPTHPESPTAYTDLLVRAWGRGDRVDTAQFGTDAVTARLFGYATPGGRRWRRTDASASAGTTYVSYDDDAVGGHLVLAVGNTAQQRGQSHAVYDARFTG